MAKYIVEVNREVCVSTGACYSTDSLHYEPGEERKSKVVAGQTDKAKSTRVFDDDQIAIAKEAARECPVSAITVTEL